MMDPLNPLLFTFHRRYPIVWVPKYRFKVRHGEVRLQVREIIRKVYSELRVTIINGALPCDHAHIFAKVPPHNGRLSSIEKAATVMMP